MKLLSKKPCGCCLFLEKGELVLKPCLVHRQEVDIASDIPKPRLKLSQL